MFKVIVYYTKKVGDRRFPGDFEVTGDTVLGTFLMAEKGMKERGLDKDNVELDWQEVAQ